MNGYCLLSSIHGWLFHSKASSYWGTPIYGNYTYIYIDIHIYIHAYIYIYMYISHEQSRLIPICTDRITRSLLTATSLPEARTEVWGNMGHPWTNEKGTHGPMKNMIGLLSWDDNRYNMDMYIYMDNTVIVNIQYPSILIRKIYNG